MLLDPGEAEEETVGSQKLDHEKQKQSNFQKKSIGSIIEKINQSFKVSTEQRSGGRLKFEEFVTSEGNELTESCSGDIRLK